MNILFSDEDRQNGINIVEIPEDELTLEGERLSGEGKSYVIRGTAVIEGERYHDFEIAFELFEAPAEESAQAVMEADWDWYDYLC